MPESLHDAETGSPNLYFADDLAENSPELKLLASELWSADEVQNELGTDWPKYGRWLPVQDGIEERSFAYAPSELIDELQDLDIETGDVFQVTRIERAGPEDHAPYEVNVSVPDGA